ncbi:MAG: hypothetical protein GY869_03105 [Planctomycetes bacterium]|nr:hypothetical protein [Planctomycetota bacterium]
MEESENDKQTKNESQQNNKRQPKAVAEYSNDNLLMSGWILGEDKIKGKAAIIDAPYGDGNVILFGFNVHNRAQSYVNFKLLLNALY